MQRGFLVKKYRRMFIASLLGWVVSMVGETADSIFAGIFISEEAVAAVELVAPIFSILYFAASALGVGTATMFSRAAGGFDTKRANKIAGMGAVTAVTIGIVLALLMVIFEDQYFMFYGSSPEIELLAREYYKCFIVMSIVYPVYWLIYHLVSVDGDDLMILAVDLLSAAGNVLCTWALVVRFGIIGIGFGTVVSFFISAVPLAIHFFKKTNSVHFKLSFSLSEFKNICAVGSTVSLTNLYIAIIDIVMNKHIIENYGDEYLPAYAVINFILNFACCLSCAVDAGGPYICVAYGEKNPVAMRHTMKLITNATIITGAAFIVGVELLAPVFPQLFGVENPEVYEMSVYAARVLGFSYCVTSFVYEWLDYYPKIGRVFLGNMIGMVYMLAAPIICVLPLSKLHGFKGLIWGFFLTPFAAALYVFIYVAVKEGVKKFPFIIEDSPDDITMYEFAVTDEQIIMLRDAVGERLDAFGVDAGTSNMIRLLIEETMEIVKQKNAGKKILADCTLAIGDDEVRVITRDRGVIFDITDTDADIDSFGAYVTASLMGAGQEKTNMTTIACNRNSFTWKRNKNA